MWLIFTYCISYLLNETFRIINFGHLFRLAAKEIDAQFRSDSFDSCVVEVGRDDVHSFVETLFNLMD
jgi:hypothetical protein